MNRRGFLKALIGGVAFIATPFTYALNHLKPKSLEEKILEIPESQRGYYLRFDPMGNDGEVVFSMKRLTNVAPERLIQAYHEDNGFRMWINPQMQKIMPEKFSHLKYQV